MPTVAFQGEHGAYSEEAARQHFGDQIETLPCQAFEEIFEAVDQGRAQYGVVPVENSTAGSINKSYDLLLEHDLKVHGEIMLRVRHCLMTVPGNLSSNGGKIQEVRSHPQALAQCEGYLNRHNYKAMPWYDTAGSAKDLAAALKEEKPVEGVAVIASKLSAQYYNLEIIEQGVEDFNQNYTRFFVVGEGDPPRSDRNKTSLVFGVPERPGTLFDALSEFARRKINLCKIESRPRRGRLWEYVFYLDLNGHWQDPNVAEAIMYLLNRAVFVKLLGSYPAASPLESDKSGVQSTLLQI